MAAKMRGKRKNSDNVPTI